MRISSYILLVINTLLFFVIIADSANAQSVILDDFIGQDALPSDDDEICIYPTYPEVNTDLEGLTEGDLIYDFKLYTLEGDSIVASELLSDGKPALFIGGSYTCWVFREKISLINSLQVLYGDQINIVVVYMIEPHPEDDYSPYYPTDYPGLENIEDGVLYNQPNTYTERKSILTDMLEVETINVPIVIDGPCNEWWINFGTNPNQAYLVNSDGIIYDAQQWFDRYPEDIVSSIEGLLSEVDPDPDPVADGYFNAFAQSEDCISGPAGETILSYITIENEALTDSYLDIIKLDSDLPEGWLTSLCTDVCYPPDVTIANMFIETGEEDEFSIYFYTTPEVMAVGTLNLLIQNHFNTDNMYILQAKACAEYETTSVEYDLQLVTDMHLFPSPASQSITCVLPSDFGNAVVLTIRDISGKEFYNSTHPYSGNIVLDIDNLSGGIYVLEAMSIDGSKSVNSKFVVQ